MLVPDSDAADKASHHFIGPASFVSARSSVVRVVCSSATPRRLSRRCAGRTLLRGAFIRRTRDHRYGRPGLFDNTRDFLTGFRRVTGHHDGFGVGHIQMTPQGRSAGRYNLLTFSCYDGKKGKARYARKRAFRRGLAGRAACSQ